MCTYAYICGCVCDVWYMCVCVYVWYICVYMCVSLCVYVSVWGGSITILFHISAGSLPHVPLHCAKCTGAHIENVHTGKKYQRSPQHPAPFPSSWELLQGRRLQKGLPPRNLLSTQGNRLACAQRPSRDATVLFLETVALTGFKLREIPGLPFPKCWNSWREPLCLAKISLEELPVFPCPLKHYLK